MLPVTTVASVVKNVDNNFRCRIYIAAIEFPTIILWIALSSVSIKLGPGGIYSMYMCLIKELSTLIDENFLGPMEYSFNCNVTSKCQLCLCFIKNSSK